MRREDTTNADMLLGNLAKDVFGEEISNYPKPLGKKSSQITLFIILLLYGYAIIEIIFALINFQVNSSLVWLISFLVIAQLISSEKNYVLFSNYAPDLNDPDINYRSFSLFQSIISNLILGSLILICALGIASLSNYTYSLLTVATFLTISMVLYVNFSDLVLTSQGLGMSLLAFTSGIASPYRNWMRAVSLSDNSSKRLALIRFFYILTVFTLIWSNKSIIIILVLPIFYAVYFYYYEIKNASRLIMRIRGRLNELTPGSIPTEIADNFDKYPHPLAIPFAMPKSKRKRISNYGAQFSSKLDINIGNRKHEQENYPTHVVNKPRSIDRNEDPGPYAAKTLKRIIDKVRSEGPLQPRGRTHYCMNCGSQMQDSASFCTQCGGTNSQ